MKKRVLLLIVLTACTDDAGKIRGVSVTETWSSAGLSDRVDVIRTEGNVPHVYGKTRKDVARVMGFVFARDRFFMMDLARRLGLGILSELLGSSGLETDQRSRGTGMTWVADQMTAALTAELAEHVDAFADGVNDYIERVRADELPPPSEIMIAGGLLGYARPADAMMSFARRDVMAIVAVTLYQSSFETGDVNRAAAAQTLDTAFQGATDEALRRAGLRELWNWKVPTFDRTSAPGFGVSTGAHGLAKSKQPVRSQDTTSASGKTVPKEVLARLSARLDALQIKLNRDKVAGYGSNAWAVAGYASKDGSGLLAGDGHLSLAIPTLLFQFGLDTELFGKGDLHQLGLTIPGFPVMAIGTNGKVAWSQTQLGEDITDWYREELQLGADGFPAATKWHGEWKPLVRTDEKYVIAKVAALGSAGGTETWPRFTTFDGRWIADVEGRKVMQADPLAPGEVLLNIQGIFVVPQDLDGDGVITAVSFDYTGFDAAHVIASTDALGRSKDVEEFRQRTRGLVGYSQNFAVADGQGNVLYTSYQAIPCRKYLPRNTDGTWMPGANPEVLLDGTRYGAFEIPIANDAVDESLASDEYKCVVPFDRIPQSINPDSGFVVTANNDPGGLSLDGSLTNDEWYLGGPWNQGFRADTISRALEKAVAEKRADADEMAHIQGNFDSRIGEILVPHLLDAIRAGKAGSDARAQAVWSANQAAFDEVESRLVQWQERGFQARSGVKTFYDQPNATDRENAVATTIFNAWSGRFLSAVWDDEKPGTLVIHQLRGEGKVGVLNAMLDGRGDGNKTMLASWNPVTKESVFFDVLGTAEVESSRELILKSLADALAFLSAPPAGRAEGGFGTTDMSEWLWGLRHVVRFRSLITDFLGDDPTYAFLTNQLQIDTSIIPLDEEIEPTDPRSKLQWFPRNGDQYGVDAANPDFSGTTFYYDDGPVMRMVVALKGDRVSGRNITPGGQSGLIDSDHFADQAKLWIANQTYPLRFHPSDVAEGAIGHEVFRP